MQILWSQKNRYESGTQFFVLTRSIVKGLDRFKRVFKEESFVFMNDNTYDCIFKGNHLWNILRINDAVNILRDCLNLLPISELRHYVFLKRFFLLLLRLKYSDQQNEKKII